MMQKRSAKEHETRIKPYQPDSNLKVHKPGNAQDKDQKKNKRKMEVAAPCLPQSIGSNSEKVTNNGL